MHSPLRNKLEVFKNLENELRTVKIQLTDKEDQLIAVQKSLDRERDEKMAMIEEKNRDDEELIVERKTWQIEKQELKKQIDKLIEETNNNISAKLSEAEAGELDQAYQRLRKEKELIEHESALLKSENRRLQMIIASPNEMDHLKHSNFHEEDFGYSSSRNTLEKHQKQTSSITSSQLSEGDFNSLHHSNIQNNHSTTSTLERKLKSFFGFSKGGGKNDLCSPRVHGGAIALNSLI